MSQPQVEAVFKSYPPAARRLLKCLRTLILETARQTDGVGRVEETLKWNEPAYVTPETGAGSTIRLGWKSRTPNLCALYFICNTNLVDTFRSLFPHLAFEGNRAVLFDLDDELPEDEIRQCVRMALTYHLDKRASGRQKPARR
ncbi:MAG: DUF1801 domain-containing protein [Proteobacteria bacterium]|nr:DUF1801 domain-containing protein [Pseudomonadota bacterium]